ncbi:MAG: glutathione S-transferase family protein [Tranquillimonas sp.]|jgi:glutathione S-transferase
MSDLVFYTNPMSRGRIVRWMLEEVGQPYEARIVPLDAPRPAEFLSANPMGKVPTLVHGGRAVTEAAAICAYLADAFPEAGLAPPVGDRGAYYRWLFFAAGPLETAVTLKGLEMAAPEGRESTVGWGSYDRTIDALEAALAGRPYVADSGFSAADVYVGSQVGWGLAFGTMPARPAFQAYWHGLRDRPAYRRATEIDDALMPPKD